MIAACCERGYASSNEIAVKRFDAMQCVFKPNRIGRHIAEIGKPGRVKRRDGRRLIDHPHHRRGITHRPRPVSRASSIGRATIPRYPHKTNLHAL